MQKRPFFFTFLYSSHIFVIIFSQQEVVMTEYKLGLDIGSTTIKIVLIDEKDNILFEGIDVIFQTSGASS